MTWVAVELEIAAEFRALSERQDDIESVLAITRRSSRWARLAIRCANAECASGEFVPLNPRTLFCSKPCCERLRHRHVEARVRARTHARMQADVEWLARHKPIRRLRRVPSFAADLRARLARVATLRKEAKLCAGE